jgi:hypothetical protein
MSSFSILGSGPSFRRPVEVGGIANVQQSESPRYIDIRRQKLGREVYRAMKNAKAHAPKRLRCKTHPPEKPVVILASKRDGTCFRLLVTTSELKAEMTPQQAMDRLRDACNVLPSGTNLHNSSFNHFIIRVTLVTNGGFSKFEGTPAQMLDKFPPLPNEASEVS